MAFRLARAFAVRTLADAYRLRGAPETQNSRTMITATPATATSHRSVPRAAASQPSTKEADSTVARANIGPRFSMPGCYQIEPDSRGPSGGCFSRDLQLIRLEKKFWISLAGNSILPSRAGESSNCHALSDPPSSVNCRGKAAPAPLVLDPKPPLFATTPFLRAERWSRVKRKEIQTRKMHCCP